MGPDYDDFVYDVLFMIDKRAITTEQMNNDPSIGEYIADFIKRYDAKEQFEVHKLCNITVVSKTREGKTVKSFPIVEINPYTDIDMLRHFCFFSTDTATGAIAPVYCESSQVNAVPTPRTMYYVMEATSK